MFIKFLRSKLFISVILLILTGILVFVLLPMNYEKQATTIEVIQLVRGVKAGTQITDAMVTPRTIGGYNIDKGVITNKEDIVGRYAAMDIRATSNLYSDMFTETWEEVDGAIDISLKEEDQLITLSLRSGSASVGGNIKPGSVVDVYTSRIVEDEDNETAEKVMGIDAILKNVVVYSVQNAALENISELQRQWISLVESGSEEAANFDKSLTPAFVTLIVDEEQALSLSTQEMSGNVQLILSPNKDMEEAAAYHKKLAEERELAELEAELESEGQNNGDAPSEDEESSTTQQENENGAVVPDTANPQQPAA